jgi:hypothetical protein
LTFQVFLFISLKNSPASLTASRAVSSSKVDDTLMRVGRQAFGEKHSLGGVKGSVIGAGGGVIVMS